MKCECQNIRHETQPPKCKNGATKRCLQCRWVFCASCAKSHHAHKDFEKIPVVDRVFDLEEINGGLRCPTYLYRWCLLRFTSFQIYLHHFVGDDWSRDLHDHPKRFISIGLWGRYVEENPRGERTYQAPWIRTFPATHIHRLRLIDKRPCWTMVIVLKAVRPWGFWHMGTWIPWRQYVGGRIADKMRNC